MSAKTKKNIRPLKSLPELQNSTREPPPRITGLQNYYVIHLRVYQIKTCTNLVIFIEWSNCRVDRWRFQPIKSIYEKEPNN